MRCAAISHWRARQRTRAPSRIQLGAMGPDQRACCGALVAQNEVSLLFGSGADFNDNSFGRWRARVLVVRVQRALIIVRSLGSALLLSQPLSSAWPFSDSARIDNHLHAPGFALAIILHLSQAISLGLRSLARCSLVGPAKAKHENELRLAAFHQRVRQTMNLAAFGRPQMTASRRC